MRYLGNKTKLLPEIEAFATAKGARGEVFLDAFAGTSAVGAAFKERGYIVHGCDLLTSSFVSQVALLEVNRAPRFRGLLGMKSYRRGLNSRTFEAELEALPRGTPRELGRAVTLLDSLVEPEEGLIFRHYAPSGEHGRKYYRDEHARALDGKLNRLREWWREGRLSRGEFHLLLYAVLDAADRVANIAGVYAAYLKNWQSNTRGSLALRPPEIIHGPRGFAHQGDINELIAELECDILYLDPPYNTRQYAAYYHVREVMAELHEVDDLDAYEASLYGKTGMRPYDDLKSDYCVRRKKDGRPACEQAFLELIERSRARHIIVSYNEEGIISRETICEALAKVSGRAEFDPRDHRAVGYKRFRSDANGRNGRRYQVLDGKGADRVDEWLFYAKSDERRLRRARRA